MEKQQQKQDVFLSLSNIPFTAKVCKALSSETRLEILKILTEKSMSISELAAEFYLPLSSMCLHIKCLKEAGLVSVTPKPGLHGSQKLCGSRTFNISISLLTGRETIDQKPSVYVHMPIGHYSRCSIEPPCGLVSATSYLYYEDKPYGFFAPEHTDASLLWLTKGFLEYQFPNQALLQDVPSQVEFSFEICSEAPGYNNDWPSDITIEINEIPITTFTLKGDYGGRRGIYNPSWWNDNCSQFGDYKRFYITQDGCYIDDCRVSDHTIESLGMTQGYSFLFTLKVDENARHVGGMNLFGKHFGDYAQDIVMKVDYA